MSTNSTCPQHLCLCTCTPFHPQLGVSCRKKGSRGHMAHALGDVHFRTSTVLVSSRKKHQEIWQIDKPCHPLSLSHHHFWQSLLLEEEEEPMFSLLLFSFFHSVPYHFSCIFYFGYTPWPKERKAKKRKKRDSIQSNVPLSQMWCIPIIPALRRMRQED